MFGATLVDAPAKQPANASRSTIEAYRDSVFRGECDPAINFAARRIDAEWEADRRTYQARVQACNTLHVDLPALELAAAKTAAELAEAETFANSVLPDSLSIGDVRERIRTANPKLPTNTGVELAGGLLFLCGTFPDGRRGALRSRALRSRSAVEDTRSRARQILTQTGDAGPDPEISNLAGMIEEVRRRVAGRSRVLNVAEAIVRQKAECEQLSRGNVSPPVTHTLTVAGKGQWQRDAYRTARAKLDELCELAAGKPEAEAANQRDRAELTRLEGQIEQAQQSRLERLADPRAMRWSE